MKTCRDIIGLPDCWGVACRIQLHTASWNFECWSC